MLPRLASLVLAGPPLWIACVPDQPAPPTYLLETGALPRNNEGVFLNEDLTFFFSGELDRASITGESVSIRAADGGLARGTWSISGSMLSFKPAPVLSADLSDGGYRPDTRYTVEIHGFPWVDGLRGVNGEPLRETFRFDFGTVSAHAPFETLLFVDPEPDKTRPLEFFPPPDPLAYLLGVDDAIYLASKKPIDPTSVRDEDFLLRPVGGGVPVHLRARLVENEAEARDRAKPRRAQSIALDARWESQPRAALIELVPVTRLERRTKWQLERTRGQTGVEVTGPRDFSGHPLWNAGLSRGIEVGDRGRDAGGGILREEFVDPSGSSIVKVPGVDGTAHWSDTGRVEVRWPAAAGDGSLGHVALAAPVELDDVQAISLTVPAGKRVTLPSAPGLVVLRAQGRMRIAGALVREVAGATGEAAEAATLDVETLDESLRRSVPLTSWLERMRSERRSVTVLVAGGDLVIEADAELRSSTPVLLAAGGRVRSYGDVVAGPRASSPGGPNAVYVLGEGGGGGEGNPLGSRASLLDLDPPREGNPLKEELHYAVLSGPLPSRGTVSAWTSAEAIGWPPSGKDANRNRWSVRYLRESRGTLPASLADLGAVDRPQTLEPPGSIQFLVELWVAPGVRFTPPFVDVVQLTWEDAFLGGRR